MVIVITGPTAVGKTKLSVELAKKLQGEIINADSTQIYKDLNIATAKITEAEKEGVIHHLFDIKEINDEYTVYDYQKDARKIIDSLLKQNKTPILVGGTGLYIKACLYDYQFSEETKRNYDISDTELYQKVVSLDPDNKIHHNNRKRLLRALEYMENSHLPFSAKEKTNQLLYDTVFIGLTTDRSILYDRINKRVDQMVTTGLLEEAKTIYDKKIYTKAVMTPIGYKELFPYFDGSQDLTTCLDKIKQNSRNYAKRQYTWFHHQLPVQWFTTNFEHFDKTVLEVYQYIQSIS